MRLSMNMGRVVMCILAVVAAVTSCATYDEAAPAQRVKIETYLANNELSYVITTDSAYVHLAGNKFGTVKDENNSGGAQMGDNVTFNVEAYEFTTIPAGTPYYTNKRYLAETISPNLDISLWNFEPWVVKLGSGEILNSIEESLSGSLVGDSLALFLTSSLAYGAEGMGVVSPNTAVMFVLTVEDIEK